MKLLLTITVLATVALVGCKTNGGAAGGMGDVPPAAVNACIIDADNFWTAAPGTSVVNGATNTEQGNWTLQMGTGIHQSTCTVTPIGGVINIDPGDD
jgi:hypothetical protein